MKKGKKHIVVIGGGTGTFTVLSGIKKYPYKISAIVAMSDDGGSTGRLRTELGVLPPGDVRQCLVALSEEEKLMLELLKYRFDQGALEGHNFGNLLLTALSKVTGDFNKAVSAASRLFKVRGEVIPVTVKQTELFVTLENGKTIKGEHVIDDNPPKGLEKAEVKTVYLKPVPEPNPAALKAIRDADLIVIGPGDFYGSVLANLLVKGVSSALKNSRAKKVFVCNLMTRWGQPGFKASDFVKRMSKYTPIDYCLVNTKSPEKELLQLYKKDREYLVEDDLEKGRRGEGESGEGVKVIRRDFLSRTRFNQQTSDAVKRSLIRHSPEKLGKTIISLL